MKDLLGMEVSVAPKKPKGGYAAVPGTGPKGETCKTCKHCFVRKMYSGKGYTKCELIKETRGRGTDILQKSPACSRWEKETP
jgi:hypothetical protein